MRSTGATTILPMCALLLLLPCGQGRAGAQAQAGPGTTSATNAAPHQSGTIKAVTPQDLVLTNAAGQDFAVNLPATVRVLLVDPQTHDLKTAREGSVADIAGGDKAIVSGTPGDSGQTLTATRVLLLKAGAIAAMHATQQAAWAHSLGGVVRSVDATAGTLTIGNGQRVTTITTNPATIVRRYADGSVRFEDAAKSTLAAVKPGDQVQARGTRSADNATLAADEIVAGTFSNFSGSLTAVDAGAGTVTLKDLATKKTVTVSVTPQTNLRRLTPGSLGNAGGQPGAPAGSAAAESAHSGTDAPKPTPPAGAGHGNGSASQAGGRPAGRRVDLARIVNRLPTETLAELKPGGAVMIVASGSAESGQPTAITLVSGVEQLLSGSGASQTTLSPWSLGSAEGEGGGESSGGGGGGR